MHIIHYLVEEEAGIADTVSPSLIICLAIYFSQFNYLFVTFLWNVPCAPSIHQSNCMLSLRFYVFRFLSFSRKINDTSSCFQTQANE